MVYMYLSKHEILRFQPIHPFIFLYSPFKYQANFYSSRTNCTVSTAKWDGTPNELSPSNKIYVFLKCVQFL